MSSWTAPRVRPSTRRPSTDTSRSPARMRPHSAAGMPGARESTSAKPPSACRKRMPSAPGCACASGAAPSRARGAALRVGRGRSPSSCLATPHSKIRRRVAQARCVQSAICFTFLSRTLRVFDWLFPQPARFELGCLPVRFYIGRRSRPWAFCRIIQARLSGISSETLMRTNAQT